MPCRPGPVGCAAAVAAAARELLVEHVGDRRRLHPVVVGQERRLPDLLPADLVVVERGLDERDHARLPRHVGGQKTSIWPAIELIAASAASPSSPSAVRISWAILSSPSRRHSSAISAACWAPLHLARHVERRPRGRTAARPARGTPRSAVCRSCGEPPPPSVRVWKNGVATCCDGLGGDRRQLAVVVLERVLLLRVAARVDRDDQQQEHEDAADHRDRAADQERLAIGCRRRATASRPRTSWARGPAGLVVLVEEGQGWKFVSSGARRHHRRA